MWKKKKNPPGEGGSLGVKKGLSSFWKAAKYSAKAISSQVLETRNKNTTAKRVKMTESGDLVYSRPKRLPTFEPVPGTVLDQPLQYPAGPCLVLGGSSGSSSCSWGQVAAASSSSDKDAGRPVAVLHLPTPGTGSDINGGGSGDAEGTIPPAKAAKAKNRKSQMWRLRAGQFSAGEVCLTFWVMRNLRKSMTDEHGAPLSAVLFVPRNAWLQEGVKLVGFQIKLNVLLEVGEAIRSLRKKLSEPNKADTEAELHAFSIHLNRMQNVLASVSNVEEVDKSEAKEDGAESAGNGASSEEVQTAAEGGDSGWGDVNWGGKLKGFKALGIAMAKGVSKLSKMVMPTKLSLAQCEQLVEALSSLFEEAQFFEQLLEKRNAASAATLAVEKDQAELQKKFDANTAKILSFFHDVILRMVLHDLRIMLDRLARDSSNWVSNVYD